MLRSGKVLDGDSKDPEIVALRKLNEKLARDERVIAALLPLTDGTTLAWKKS
jgi:predicted O-methyltransferase YrrM